MTPITQMGRWCSRQRKTQRQTGFLLQQAMALLEQVSPRLLKEMAARSHLLPLPPSLPCSSTLHPPRHEFCSTLCRLSPARYEAKEATTDARFPRDLSNACRHCRNLDVRSVPLSALFLSLQPEVRPTSVQRPAIQREISNIDRLMRSANDLT